MILSVLVSPWPSYYVLISLIVAVRNNQYPTLVLQNSRSVFSFPLTTIIERSSSGWVGLTHRFSAL